MKMIFETRIDAPAQRVWDILWTDATYRKWTAAFQEGSRAESDWKEGSEVLFLDKDNNGMFSSIDEMKPPHSMVFRHHGEMKGGERQAKDWGDAIEAYTLEEQDGKTHLKVLTQMEIPAEFEAYFQDTFPKALQNVKDLSEGRA